VSRISVFVLGVLSCALVSCSSSKNSGDGAASPPVEESAAKCEASIRPTASAREIQVAQMPGDGMVWQLIHGEVFQSIGGNGQSLYIAVSVDKSSEFTSPNRICGGGSNGTIGDFNFHLAREIGSTHKVESQLNLYMTVNPESIQDSSQDSRADGVDSLDSDQLPAGSVRRIALINDVTLEIWYSGPTAGANTSGRFVSRAVYTASPK
jgi:hypothetical protein